MITVIGEALVDVHFDGDLIRPHPRRRTLQHRHCFSRAWLADHLQLAFSTDQLGHLLRDALVSSVRAESAIGG